MTTKILCLGFGFCANGLWHYWRDQNRLKAYSIAASHRDPDKKKLLLAKNIAPFSFTNGDLNDALAHSDAWLISASPAAAGDPLWQDYATAINRHASDKKIIYLSTTGVYGNHDGAWVDETSPLQPNHERSKKRIMAEQQWQAKGATLLRLGGIYGPRLDGMGQNTLQSIIDGKARRIEKSGQVFGRIHVMDIAVAIDQLLQQHNRTVKGAVFNLVDDEPANPRLVVEYGYQLLRRPLPPLEDFALVAPTLSPMARSFFDDNKRVRNDKIKNQLGWQPRYPSYREGLAAIHAAMQKDMNIIDDQQEKT